MQLQFSYVYQLFILSSYHFQKHVSSQVEFNQQNDSVNFSVKTEQSNMEFEDANINDNNNPYEDTAEVSICLKSFFFFLIEDSIENNSKVTI